MPQLEWISAWEAKSPISANPSSSCGAIYLRKTSGSFLKYTIVIYFFRWNPGILPFMKSSNTAPTRGSLYDDAIAGTAGPGKVGGFMGCHLRDVVMQRLAQKKTVDVVAWFVFHGVVICWCRRTKTYRDKQDVCIVYPCVVVAIIMYMYMYVCILCTYIYMYMICIILMIVANCNSRSNAMNFAIIIMQVYYGERRLCMYDSWV